MSSDNITKLEEYLKTQTESDWMAAIAELEPSIHAVDRDAIQVWLRFHSTALFEFLASAEDADLTKNGLAMQGEFELDSRIDTSHDFLYGHRHWKAVKAAVEAEAQVFENRGVLLSSEITQLATMIAEKVKADPSLLIAITVVGLITLAQVGLEKLKAAGGDINKPIGIMSKSPDAIVTARNRDDSQGVLGFLKTVNKKFSVTYDESTGGKFAIISEQEIASASGNDRSQNWQAKDERCWEGPVPVECVSASCGTCWVGVLGGAEKLTAVSARERRAMKVFGYNQPDDEKPFIRLACQARATGNISIVIPPWNGVFGKKVYGNVEDLELEPVTTSAKALREAVRTATSSERPE